MELATSDDELATILSKHGTQITLFTCASPRVGNQTFVTRLDGLVDELLSRHPDVRIMAHRLVDRKDLVPSTPSSDLDYVHFGETWMYHTIKTEKDKSATPRIQVRQEVDGSEQEETRVFDVLHHDDLDEECECDHEGWQEAQADSLNRQRSCFGVICCQAQLPARMNLGLDVKRIAADAEANHAVIWLHDLCEKHQDLTSPDGVQASPPDKEIGDPKPAEPEVEQQQEEKVEDGGNGVDGRFLGDKPGTTTLGLWEDPEGQVWEYTKTTLADKSKEFNVTADKLLMSARKHDGQDGMGKRKLFLDAKELAAGGKDLEAAAAAASDPTAAAAGELSIKPKISNMERDLRLAIGVHGDRPLTESENLAIAEILDYGGR